MGTLKVCHATGEGLGLGVGFVTGRYGASAWRPPNRPVRGYMSSTTHCHKAKTDHGVTPNLRIGVLMAISWL